MSTVGIAELIAWVLSALIAAWILQDMVRVNRTHDEASLVNAPDPLADEGPGATRPATEVEAPASIGPRHEATDEGRT